KGLAERFGLLLMGLYPWRCQGKACRPSRPSKAREIDGRVAIERLATPGHRVLQAGGAIEQYDVVGLLQSAVGKSLPIGGTGRRAFGAQQNSVQSRNLIERRRNRAVLDSDGEAAGLANSVENEKIADRGRHPNSGRHRVRVFPELGMSAV